MLQVSENSLVSEAPRERAEKYGVGVLSNAELWALILRTGMTGLPITTLTTNLMKANDDSLMKLERRSREERTALPGVGMVKAIQIEAVYEIAKRYFREGPEVTTTIRSSKDIFSYMRTDIGNLPHEEIWVILLKRNNQIIGKKRITIGSATHSVFDVKSIMRQALLEKAEALILCHNHPSGTLAPSLPDMEITQKTKDACKSLDINFLDHVIIASHGYYSFLDKGKL